jgi:Ca2+-binding RTX toxin-like protein
MRRVLLAGAIATLGLSAVPATASAVTVNFVPKGLGGELQVVDLTGESNSVTVRIKGNDIEVSDSTGATSQSIPPCVQVDPRTVRCPLGVITTIKVLLGGRDDFLFFDAIVIGAVIQGGPGDDTISGTDAGDDIEGGGGDDDIDGEDGNDKAAGGPGRDRIEGFNGRDWLYGGAQNDFLFGERGNDWLFGGKGKGDKCNGGPAKDKQRGCEIGVQY